MLLETADDFGNRAIENPLKLRNLHATMMHLLAVQPETPTINHDGREMRLSDVNDQFVRDLCTS